MAKSKHKQQAAVSRSATLKQDRKSKSNTSYLNSGVLPIAIALLVVTFIAFFPTFSNDFVNWDDGENIYDNANLVAFDWNSIQKIFTSNIMGGYNPLPIFTFAIERALFGLNPVVFHTNNLLLHLICVFLVFRIGLLMKLNQWHAAILALLFGIHPMRVESVAWATERKDVLFGAFYFGAILYYIKYLLSDRRNSRYIIMAIVLGALSLFSKVQAVALPLSFLALDYYFKRPLKLNLIFEKWIFWGMSLAMGLFNIYSLGKEETLTDSTYFTFFDRLLIGFTTFGVYLGKCIYPWIMSPLYPYPSKLETFHYISPVWMAGFLIAGWYAWKNGWKNTVFGMAFFFFNIVFMLQFLGAGQGYLADRFTYVAYFGLFFIITASLQGLIEKNKNQQTVVYGAIAVYLALFAGMTFNQTKIWKNGATLWTQALNYEKQTNLPYYNRGQYYRDSSQTELALQDFQQAVKLAAKPEIYNSIGKLYFDKGNADEAIKNYDLGISKDSTNPEIYINRGAAHGMRNELDLALADLSKGISMIPVDAQGEPRKKDRKPLINAYLNRSLTLFNLRRFEESLTDHDKYLKFDPYNADMWYEKGLVLNVLERYAEALPVINKAIELSQNQIREAEMFNDQNKLARLKQNLPLFYIERARANNKSGNRPAAEQDIATARQLGYNVTPADLQRIGLQ